MQLFVMIKWPESQFLQDQIWFDECFLLNDEEGLVKYGPATYFVPFDRWEELKAQLLL